MYSLNTFNQSVSRRLFCHQLLLIPEKPSGSRAKNKMVESKEKSYYLIEFKMNYHKVKYDSIQREMGIVTNRQWMWTHALGWLWIHVSSREEMQMNCQHSSRQFFSCNFQLFTLKTLTRADGQIKYEVCSKNKRSIWIARLELVSGESAWCR